MIDTRYTSIISLVWIMMLPLPLTGVFDESPNITSSYTYLCKFVKSTLIRCMWLMATYRANKYFLYYFLLFYKYPIQCSLSFILLLLWSCFLLLYFVFTITFITKVAPFTVIILILFLVYLYRTTSSTSSRAFALTIYIYICWWSSCFPFSLHFFPTASPWDRLLVHNFRLWLVSRFFL